MKRRLIHEDVSREIIGASFDIHNELGPNHKEIVYQRSLAVAMVKRDLLVVEQVRTPISYEGKKVGTYILDFVVNDQVIVEIKRHIRFTRSDFKQAEMYLQSTGHKLALLVAFGNSGVVFRRVLNPDNLINKALIN